jgi:hypothetical protein
MKYRLTYLNYNTERRTIGIGKSSLTLSFDLCARALAGSACLVGTIISITKLPSPVNTLIIVQMEQIEPRHG